MAIQEIELGRSYEMPPGVLPVKVTAIVTAPYPRVQLEYLAGKSAGNRRWESAAYFMSKAVRPRD